MAKKKRAERKHGGSSMLVPPEREQYQLGALVKGLTQGAKALIKKATASLPKKESDKVIKETEKRVKAVSSTRTRPESEQGDPGGDIGQRDVYIQEQEYILTEDRGQGLSEETILFNMEELSKVRNELDNSDQYTEYLESLIEQKRNFEDEFIDVQLRRETEGELAAETAAYMEGSGKFEPDDVSSAEGMDLMFLPEKIEREVNPVTDQTGRTVSQARYPRQEGGSMMVPPEMEEVVSSEAPVDAYPNIPPEEMAEVEASQLPDQEMEDDYVDFVISEALEQEEQDYLRNTLEADSQLSMIFDKVVETASEFSGSGEVAGPGSGVSDSIPARLSDGEFVVTKKATDHLGADNLQLLVDEAERAFDGGLMEKDNGIEDEEIRKSMVASNQMPSLNVRQR